MFLILALVTWQVAVGEQSSHLSVGQPPCLYTSDIAPYRRGQHLRHRNERWCALYQRPGFEYKHT